MFKGTLKRLLIFLLTITMILGNFNGFNVMASASDVEGQGTVLIITGSGAKKEMSFTLEQLRTMTDGKIIQDYSTVNRVGTKKLQAGEGITLSQFLKLAGVVDNYTKITFYASDGFKKEFTKEQINTKRYYYPEVLNGKEAGVKPAETIIAFKSLAITTGTIDHNSLKNNEGTPPLQLMIGQENLKDVNNSLFVSNIQKIVVDNPLPAAFTISGGGIEEKSYTTADIKLMTSKTQSYTYSTKAGPKTSTAKGVSLKSILEALKLSGEDIKLQINTTDGKDYPVAPVELKEIVNENMAYLIAYEVDGAAVNASGKDATDLRIYRKAEDSSAVIKNVTGITILKEAAQQNGKSQYKHISYDGAPYNIDAVTSATLTIEGPGLEDRQIVTMRQLESMDEGIKKVISSENINGKTVENTYEGITLEYILKKVVKLKPNAENLIFWDKNLQKIGEYSLESVMSGDGQGNKMIIAYGVNGLPLVFDNTYPGYEASKYNDNGCIRLVTNKDQNVGNASFKTLSRIQINEKDAKNVYEHNYSPYNKPEYEYDTLTITGEGIGKEVIYSLKDIEAICVSDKELSYEGLYSLQNSASYWNNHVLKGVVLYELLLKSGLSKDLPDSTSIRIIAKDGYSTGPYTLGDIKNSERYGVYIKDIKEPVKTGMPVIISYGADGYPFVPLNTDVGFVNGVDNNGGPMRITFGQKSLEDINGPNQIKYVSKIIVGNEKNLSAHEYSPYDTLKNSTLSVKIFSEDSKEPIKTSEFKLSDIEGVTFKKDTQAYALGRNYFSIKKNNEFYNDFYQGVNLWYMLKDMVGFSGTEGTITFSSAGVDMGTISIGDLNKPNNDYSDFYNAITGIKNIKPILAYSKNGYPLVSEKDEKLGYVSEITSGDWKIAVKNNGGPLCVIIPQSLKNPDGLYISSVDEIKVKIAPDPCAHTKEPYNAYNNEISIKGTGVKKEATIKVSEVEEMIDFITIQKYYVLNQKEVGEEIEYKGIGLYDFLRQTVGLQPNAEKILVTAADGYVKEFTVQDIIKSDYINEKSNTNNLKMMMAYGKNGKPLVPGKKDTGFDEAAKNDGGPLQIVVGQKSKRDKNSSSFIKSIKKIEVVAGKETSWKHDSPLYQKYLDTTIFTIAGSEVKNPISFTLRQIEALNLGAVRDTYTSSQDVAQFEGIDLKYLINNAVGLKAGIIKPTKITIYSGSKYQRNIDVNQVWDGVLNTKGVNKKIILGYAREGYPLVPKVGDVGYASQNAGGPLKLIMEENISMWIKSPDLIVVGEGEYQAPVNAQSDWKTYVGDGKTLPNASVRCITPDGKGGTWIGTYGAGAIHIDSKGAAKVYNTSNSMILDNTVYSIAVDTKGRTWISMGGPETAKGVLLIDRNGCWRIFNRTNSMLPDDYIHAISIDRNEGIWFATGKGAAYFDSNSRWHKFDKSNSLLPSLSVNEILQDKKGGLWFGCYPDTVNEKDGIYKGGYVYMTSAWKWVKYDSKDTSIGDNWARSISMDKDGGVWIVRSGNYAGGGKVDYIDSKGNRRVYDDKELYPDLPAGDTIRVAAVDKNGGLWMGTSKSGVIYRSPDGKIQVYNSTNGAFSDNKWDNVYYINKDIDGNVWIGTNGGVGMKAVK